MNCSTLSLTSQHPDLRFSFRFFLMVTGDVRKRKEKKREKNDIQKIVFWLGLRQPIILTNSTIIGWLNSSSIPWAIGPRRNGDHARTESAKHAEFIVLYNISIYQSTARPQVPVFWSHTKAIRMMGLVWSGCVTISILKRYIPSSSSSITIA